MSPREPDTAALTSMPSDLALDTLANEKKEDVEKKTTRLTWGYVQVREYNRIVGDHPDTIIGPPMTLDWEFNEHKPVSVSDYEENRPKRKVYWRLRLSSITRKNLLKNEFGIPEEEIAASEKEVQAIRRRRESTNKQGKLSTSVETAVQSAKRKIRRFSRENILRVLSAAGSPFCSPLQKAY